MSRHEDILELQALAASAGKPDHLPIVNQRARGPGQQEKAALRGLAVDAQETAANCPSGVIDPAQVAKAAGKNHPTGYRSGLARGLDTGANARVGIGTPNVLLGARIEGGQQLVMIAEDIGNPGLRGATAGQGLTDLADHIPPQFVAAEARWPANRQDAASGEIVDRLLRAAAQFLASLRPFAQPTYQRLSPRNHFGGGGNVSGHRPHAWAGLGNTHSPRPRSRANGGGSRRLPGLWWQFIKTA